MIRFPIAVSIAFCLLCSSISAQEKISKRHAEEMKASRKLFVERVRPALVKHCLKCHGGDKTRGEFSLASRGGVLKGGESGAAIVARKPGESPLLTMIEEGDMPPEDEPRIPNPLIADIRRWIQLGAAYDKPLVDGPSESKFKITDDDRNFWAFRPLSAKAPPSVKNDWVRNDIDRFILARLRRNGLEPNPPASKRARARRAALNLLGLPAPQSALDEFLRNDSPQAWPRYIDRLLASEDYGPRWARHWMDVARFAESSGFEHDSDRKTAYHYRDFLIQAFNRDLPWNTFVTWQLAGDEVAPDEPLAQMATGFLAAGVFPTQLTENEFESARYDEIDDMLNTTGMAFLGLSIGCARCHDHKYDPIPASDYYQLAATFARAIRSERSIEFESEQHQQKLASWRAKEAVLAKALDEYRRSTITPAFAEWLKQPELPMDLSASAWRVLNPKSMKAKNATLSRQPDGSVLATDKNAKSDEYTFVAELDQPAAAMRLEALTHGSLPRKGPGRAGNGNFQLSHVTVEALPASDAAAKGIAVKLTAPRATHQQNKGNLSIASSIDGNQGNTGWAVDAGGIGKDQAAIFAFEKPLPAKTKLTVRLLFAGNVNHNLGRFRLAVAADASADFELGKGADAALAAAFDAIRKKTRLSEDLRAKLEAWFALRDEGYLKVKSQLDAHRTARPEPVKKSVMICSEGVSPLKHNADGRGYPHFYPQVHHLEGGDVKRKGEAAEAGFLTVLLPNDAKRDAWSVAKRAGSKATFRRATLANWMTDSEKGAGHLLARVVVNRVWHHHFGRGIVSTPNDFGMQGQRPSHPDLLDWLAADLIANGWKLKRLHRLIMTSAVYQQSSQTDAARSEKDLDNRLLWRYSPRRLEAEAIRDSLLSVSGMLDRTPFGPGARDANMARRSIYFTIKRSAPPNAMIVFDWPEHLVSIGRRPSTTIAPQALHFMNSPQVRRYADGLAKRTKGDTAARIQRVYEIAYGRPASAKELAIAAQFVQSQAAVYAGQADASHRALVDLCQTILASNEFLYLP